MRMVLAALHFAALKHRMAHRTDGETPYINHPIEVCFLLSSYGEVGNTNVLAAGALHDVLEDTDTTPLELGQEFNIAIAHLVAEVTDDRSLGKDERRRKQVFDTEYLSLEAKHIRLADKTSNIRSLVLCPGNWTRKSMTGYLSFASQVVDQVRGASSALAAEFDKAAELAWKMVE